MRFIGGIAAGELWREAVTGSTGTFLRFEETAGLAAGLTDRDRIIHGANSQNSKKMPTQGWAVSIGIMDGAPFFVLVSGRGLQGAPIEGLMIKEECFGNIALTATLSPRTYAGQST